MNGSEVYTIKGTPTAKTAGTIPRTANPDEKRDALRWEVTARGAVEQFINKAQTRITKATATGKHTVAEPGESSKDDHLNEA